MRTFRLTTYLSQNPLKALTLTFLVSFLPVVGVAGIAYAGFVTLRSGAKLGAIFVLAATLPDGINFYFQSMSDVSLFALCLTIGVAVLSNLLTWVFAIMLRRQANWGQLLQIATLLGVLFVSVVHLIDPDVANWWGQQLQLSLTQVASVTDGLLEGNMTPSLEVRTEIINQVKYSTTGTVTAFVLIVAMSKLILARWWQARVFNPGMLQRELHDIRLSRLASILFLMSWIFAYLKNSVVVDMMPVISVLFVASGLSLMHYLFGLMKSSTRWFWLCLLYVIFIYDPKNLVLIALFAVIDVWVDVRKRFKMV